MDGLQAENYSNPFYQTSLPESLPIETNYQEFPEVIQFRKLANRFYHRPALIEISHRGSIERFLPKSPLKGDSDLFGYLIDFDDELASNKIGIRQCFGCKPEENLHLVAYEPDSRNNKHNTEFLKKIGGKNNTDFPKYLFNHGKGFKSYDIAICPPCSRKIQETENFRRYVTTA
jgi:hypothetical protein